MLYVILGIIIGVLLANGRDSPQFQRLKDRMRTKTTQFFSPKATIVETRNPVEDFIDQIKQENDQI